MKLDLRDQMAVNLCASMDETPGEKFRTLAYICKMWGYGLEESMPLAYTLKDKLGLNDLKAYEAMRATVDGLEIKLTKIPTTTLSPTPIPN